MGCTSSECKKADGVVIEIDDDADEAMDPVMVDEERMSKDLQEPESPVRRMKTITPVGLAWRFRCHMSGRARRGGAASIRAALRTRVAMT